MKQSIIIAGVVVALIVGWAGGVVQAADPGAAPVVALKIGVAPLTADQYKPVIGKPGGQLMLDTLGEPKSFNPITAGETSTTAFTSRMFQGLTDIDAFTGNVKPLLAEKWEVAEDGVTWIFHLRKDVVFNDGTPFTAQDVVFTWNDLVYDLARPEQDKPARWPCSARDANTFEGKIIKVEAVDDYTVRFITPVKVAIMDQLVGEPILSKAKYAPLVANGSFGGALNSDSKSEDLVGTGPFILGEYKRGDRVMLKRNPNYWKRDAAGGKLPYLDQEVFLIVADANVIFLNFQQKITDVYSLRSGKDVAALKPRAQDDNFTLYQLGPTQATYFVAFNLNSDAGAKGEIADYKVKWFRDARFRQAVSYAIDRNALVKNVLRNLGYPLAAPFTLAAGPFRQDGFAPYPHDPEKARALLADMGFQDRDKSGVLSDADGHKLQFTINTNSGNDIREQSADFIRKDLHDVGMNVNTLFLEFNLLVEKMDRTCDWECLVMGLTGGQEPHWGANVWKSTGRLHMWWPREKAPSFAWEKSIDDIFEQGIQEMDKAKRKDIYRKWIEIIYREQPFIYLTCGEQVIALRNRFGNIFPAPLGLLHNEEEIFVK